MNRQQTREIYQRLKLAERKTREAYQHVVVGYDWHEGSQIAQMWPFVTAGYCGVEQSFKFLIARRKGLPTVRKLLDEEKSARGRSQYNTHDLLFLFQKLDPLEQSQLSNDFQRFTSLYDHIPVRSLSEFLEIVCNDRGDGYVLWRYSLTEFDSALPSNSVEALLAVWRAGIQIVRAYVNERPEVRMIAHEINELFSSHLDQFLADVSAQRQNSGFGYEDYTAEFASWMKQFDHPLNAYSRLVHDFYRGLGPDSRGASGQLAQALRRWVAWAVAAARNRDIGADAQQFVTRALGGRGNWQGVRWNKSRLEFEGVPWSLDELVANKPPDGAYRFIATMDDWRRQNVVNWIYALGFRVNENRPYRNQMPPGKWLCTLSAGKTWTNSKPQVIRLWEHPDPDSDFFVELDGNERSDDAATVRQRIEGWAQLGQLSAKWLPNVSTTGQE